MSNPTVSVVTPNYNHAEYLPKAIESVLRQTHRPDEYLILDDASTDTSCELISSYAASYPFIRLIKNEENMGVAASVERLLKASTGDYLFSLGADDTAHPDLIAQSMQLLTAHPEAGLCSSLSEVTDEEGHNFGIYTSPIPSFRRAYFSPDEVPRKLCRYGPWFMGNTTIYRRQALIEAGGFLPELLSFTDGFISHVLALKHGACFIPDPLGVWRRTASGESSITAQDHDRGEAVVSRALELMTASPEYSHLFPKRYVRQWLKRRVYWTGTAALEDISESHLRLSRIIDEQRMLPGFLVHLLNIFIKVILKTALLTTRASLHLRCLAWPSTPLMIKWYIRQRQHKRSAYRSPANGAGND